MMSVANGTRNACAEAEVTLPDKETVIAIPVVIVSIRDIAPVPTSGLALDSRSPAMAAVSSHDGHSRHEWLLVGCFTASGNLIQSRRVRCPQ
jgi:hypothetical protein